LIILGISILILELVPKVSEWVIKPHCGWSTGTVQIIDKYALKCDDFQEYNSRLYIIFPSNCKKDVVITGHFIYEKRKLFTHKAHNE
jgi:hypothetical protein